jgi:hypothetical protein
MYLRGRFGFPTSTWQHFCEIDWLRFHPEPQGVFFTAFSAVP